MGFVQVLELLGFVGTLIIAAFSSSIDDYRVRFFTRNKQKKIAKLESDLKRNLKRYEDDFADTKLFLGRMLHKALCFCFR